MGVGFGRAEGAERGEFYAPLAGLAHWLKAIMRRLSPCSLLTNRRAALGGSPAVPACGVLLRVARLCRGLCGGQIKVCRRREAFVSEASVREDWRE